MTEYRESEELQRGVQPTFRPETNSATKTIQNVDTKARDTSTDTDDGDEDNQKKSGLSAPLSKMPMWARWILAVIALYFLIVAVGLIGDGISGVGEDAAQKAFDFASNPFVGLFVGILATALIQSSSTTTSIVVTAVGAGALPLNVGVPVIMGANIGTSVTNTLASLGHAGNKNEFRRAFSASTVHDFFNLLAVVILFPIEWFFHPMERVSQWLANGLYGTVLPDPGNVDFIGAITDPVAGALGPDGLMGFLPGEIAPSVGTILLGIFLIFMAVRWMGKILQSIIVGRAKKWLQRALEGKPPVSMLVGFLVTCLAQSSSVTTSTMVPFAGSGTLTTRDIYPMTLGANVGTTTTAIIAALAVGSDGGRAALTMALVHLLFNVFGIILIYVLPFLRNTPVWCAEKMGKLASEHKTIAAVWVLGVFIIIPGIVVFSQALF